MVMPGRSPSLRAISAFEAAARHQSFAKAAAELNVTHSAVSHAIRSLEERYGAPLFERTGRGVTLSDAGRVLAGRVRLSIGLLNQAFEARPCIERSKLVISVLPAFAYQVLLHRLHGFRALHPHLELEIQSTWGLASLTHGEADIGLRYGPGRWAGLSAAKLADETIFPVVAPSYSGDLPGSPAELLECDLIIHKEHPWEPWLSAVGVDLPQVKQGLVLDDSFLVLEAAAAGLGIGLARSVLASPFLKDGRLRKLFDVETPSDYSYWLAWNPASPKMALIDAFRVWLESELGANPPSAG